MTTLARNNATAVKKAAFLTALAERGTVLHAAESARVRRQTVYVWRRVDTAFAEAWADSLEDSTEALEASMYERAMRGDTIAGIFLLKGRRPTVYRDQQGAATVRLEDGDRSVTFSINIGRPEDDDVV